MRSLFPPLILITLSSTVAFHAPSFFSSSVRSVHVFPALQASKTSIYDSSHQRRIFLVQATASIAALVTVMPQQAVAAPPFAVIAEELGYFPVTNRAGQTVFIPAKVRRESSEQSVKLAQHLKNIGATMYGAYWCPHCSHQKEIFGSEAWSIVPYVECSTKAFYYDANKVASVRDKVDGFPTWHFPNNKKAGKEWIGGEMPLERIVALSGFKGNFDVTSEGPTVAPSSGACS